MARRVRSARGEIVDFDLLGIKEQIASAVPPTDVVQRQTFIDSKMKRRVRKALQKATSNKTRVTVDPNLNVGQVDQEEFIDDVEPPVPTPSKPVIRQKTKPSK